MEEEEENREETTGSGQARAGFEARFFFTVGQNNQESRRKYWATCLFICSFACTAHLFVCSTLLAWLTCSTAFTHLLARSLCSFPSS